MMQSYYLLTPPPRPSLVLDVSPTTTVLLATDTHSQSDCPSLRHLRHSGDGERFVLPFIVLKPGSSDTCTVFLSTSQWIIATFRCHWMDVWGGALPAGAPQPPRMKVSLPRHGLLGKEMWPISRRRRARNLFLNGLLMSLICIGIQGVHVKLINHCQAVMIKQ